MRAKTLPEIVIPETFLYAARFISKFQNAMLTQKMLTEVDRKIRQKNPTSVLSRLSRLERSDSRNNLPQCKSMPTVQRDERRC